MDQWAFSSPNRSHGLAVTSVRGFSRHIWIGISDSINAHAVPGPFINGYVNAHFIIRVA